MRFEDLFPLIVVLLIVVVALLKAIFRALGSTDKTKPTGTQRPSVWEEFKKALQTMAEEQRQAMRGEEEAQRDMHTETSHEEQTEAEPEEVVIVRPVRRPRPAERERVQEASAPVAAPTAAPERPHRPEDLGTGISREVRDIVHSPVAEHLRQRGYALDASPEPALRAVVSTPMPQLAGASQEELRRAILLRDILSPPITERPPGSGALPFGPLT